MMQSPAACSVEEVKDVVVTAPRGARSNALNFLRPAIGTLLEAADFAIGIFDEVLISK